jgi:ParB family chromosome partitioning protein
MTVRWIPVDRIEPDPAQPRTRHNGESLLRLGGSLLTHGQLQPILLRPAAEPERYVIVHGERRWRAARFVGLPVVAAVVLDESPDPSRLFQMQILENAMREDLSPIDQARAYRALMDQNGWNVSRVAAAVHVNPGTVTRALALLDLPEEIQNAVHNGWIPASSAHELARVDDPDRQRDLAAQASAGGLDREAVRAAAGRSRTPARRPRRHVYQTSVGRVTIVLDRAAVSDPGALLVAVIELTRQVKRRRRHG